MSIAFSVIAYVQAYERKYTRPLGPLAAEDFADVREKIYAQLQNAGLFSGNRTDRDWSDGPASLVMTFHWGTVVVVELPKTFEEGVAGVAALVGQS
jgi:hypothetical protein